MKAALDTPEVEQVFLSTDDELLMQIAQEAEVEVIVRPPELCNDAALGEHAYVHGFEEIRRRNPGKEIRTDCAPLLQRCHRVFFNHQ